MSSNLIDCTVCAHREAMSAKDSRSESGIIVPGFSLPRWAGSFVNLEELMVRAIYPGSFDPVTLGHIDIIKRSASIVDELVVGVLVNKGKHPLFSMPQRYEMVCDAVKGMKNVKVETFDGMTVDFAKKHNASIIIRGLRAITDYENEMQIAQTNRSIDSDIETMFLITDLQYAYLSSTTVKEIASYGKDVSASVTPLVARKLHEKFNEVHAPKPTDPKIRLC